MRLEHICAACKRGQSEHLLELRAGGLVMISKAYGTICLDLGIDRFLREGGHR